MFDTRPRWLALCITLVVLAFSCEASAAQRIALVIGNAAYAESPLYNPVNDAIAVDERLSALGFEVVRVTDADLRSMQSALVEFTRRIEDDATALVFYAGHGVQANGRNYLVPIDARLDNESSLRFEALELNDVLEELEYSRSKLNLVVLDACRNNPFLRRFRGGSRGLAAVDAATGTLIAYATGPGAVASDGSGDNGLYTEHFLRALEQPGMQAEAVFKQVRINVADASGGDQVPWESSSLTGDFVFNRAEPPPQPPAAGAQIPTTAQGSQAPVQVRMPDAINAGAEVLFWDTAREANDIPSFRAYLEQFPEGTFAPLARARIAALENAAAAPAPVARPIATARYLEIQNDTGFAVVQIQASPAGDSSWGNDRLAGATLTTGSSRRLELPADGGTVYDVRLRDTDGDTYTFMGHDISRGVLRATLSDIDPSPTPTPSTDGNYYVDITNNTGFTIMYAYVTPAGSGNWGEDRLGTSVIANGATHRVNLSGYSSSNFDIRLQDADGDTYTYRNVDVARRDLTATLSDIDGGDSPAGDNRYYVEITNNTGYTITRIEVSHTDDQSWGNDRLGNDVLGNGASRRVDLNGYPSPVFDIRLTDADGDTYTYMGVNVAQRNITATLGDIDSNASTAGDGEYYVDVTNNTGYTIMYLHVSPVASTSWEEDVLGSDVIGNGATHRVNLRGYASPMFDIRLTDSDGDTYTFRNVDVSKRDITATLADIDS